MKIEACTEERAKIIGVTRDDPRTGLNRQDIIRRYVRAGTRLIPRLEPDNPADPNAVALWLEHGGRSFHLGYLSRSRARSVAPRLRAGYQLEISVTAVTGGTRDKPTRGVNLLIREPLKVAKQKVAPPPKVARTPHTIKIPRVVLIVIALLILCCVLIFAVALVDATIREIGLLPTYTPSPLR